MDTIEFYFNDFLLTSVESSFAPRVGDCINIKKQGYKMVNVSFSIDHPDTIFARMRCNVDLEYISNG